jgi:hypothetical protein
MLMSDNEYEDFELRLKFKVSKEHKGNTGIQIRSRYDDNAVVLNNVKAGSMALRLILTLTVHGEMV